MHVPTQCMGNELDRPRDVPNQLEACVEYRLQHPTAELLAKSQQDVLGCDVESFDR